jgi:hypothetical protein
MSAASELIAHLERATAALARDLDDDPRFALSERESALCALRANDSSVLSAEEAARLHEISRQSAVLIERVRERRRCLLDQVQEAAAARRLATALTPPAGRAIVDIRL